MGTILLKRIGRNNLKLNNSSFNKTLKENLSKLDDNNSLNDLIVKGKITISNKILDKINNNITVDNLTPKTVDCYGDTIGSIVNRQLVVDRATLDNMIANGDDITNVCTSNITDMSNLFKNNTTFNQNIASWDVSHVTNMYEMFYGASAFNQNISSWNVNNLKKPLNYIVTYDGVCIGEKSHSPTVHDYQYQVWGYTWHGGGGTPTSLEAALNPGNWIMRAGTYKYYQLTAVVIIDCTTGISLHNDFNDKGIIQTDYLPKF